MASFKLGCIKGDKGDKGADGIKGERGDKGDRGDCGSIPVFEIASVESVPFGVSASVEIDSAEPENPKLSFRIPCGKDGIDAMGDMVSGIYDTEGRKTDIFKFVNALFENALPKSGGSVAGKLFVHESPEGSACVRNIIFANSLPEKAVYGDICFITADDYENTIYKNGVGSVVLIPEGEEKFEYIVAATDYHGKGSVTLVRKHMPEFTECFNYNVRENYECSNIDYFMETVFGRLYPDYIQKIMRATGIGYNKKRHCFLLSCEELRELEYFKNNSIATTTDIGTYKSYMTRTIDDRMGVSIVNSAGQIVSTSQKEFLNIRPVIVIDGGLVVRNALYKDRAVVEPVPTDKIYRYTNGGWKELML